MNGGEAGVDCGGPCPTRCPGECNADDECPEGQGCATSTGCLPGAEDCPLICARLGTGCDALGCEAGTFCREGFLRGEAYEAFCIEEHQAGAPCEAGQLDHNDVHCAAGLSCEYVDQDAAVCSPGLGEGERCDRADFYSPCGEGLGCRPVSPGAHRSTCQPAEPGLECESSRECAHGTTCRGGVCRTPSPTGGTCFVEGFSCAGPLDGDVTCSMFSGDCLPSRTCAPDPQSTCVRLGSGDGCVGVQGTCGDGPVVFHHGAAAN